MAIRDLLWACPVCRTEGALRREGGAEVCRACSTRYRRGRGATIIARASSGSIRAMHAADWADLLPAIESTARFRDDDGGRADEDHILFRESVQARFARAYTPVRHRGRFMNRIENFRSAREGVLELRSGSLRFTDDTGERHAWPFDRLTAVQPSSSTLQVKPRRQPVVSFRFPHGSARFWEEILTTAIRRHYRRSGKGEIIEFQPRIQTR